MPNHLRESGTFNFSLHSSFSKSPPLFSYLALTQKRKTNQNALSTCLVLGPTLVAYVSYLPPSLWQSCEGTHSYFNFISEKFDV